MLAKCRQLVLGHVLRARAINRGGLEFVHAAIVGCSSAAEGHDKTRWRFSRSFGRHFTLDGAQKWTKLSVYTRH